MVASTIEPPRSTRRGGEDNAIEIVLANIAEQSPTAAATLLADSGFTDWALGDDRPPRLHGGPQQGTADLIVAGTIAAAADAPGDARAAMGNVVTAAARLDEVDLPVATALGDVYVAYVPDFADAFVGIGDPGFDGDDGHQLLELVLAHDDLVDQALVATQAQTADMIRTAAATGNVDVLDATLGRIGTFTGTYADAHARVVLDDASESDAAVAARARIAGAALGMVPGLPGPQLATMLPNALLGEVRSELATTIAGDGGYVTAAMLELDVSESEFPNRFAAGAVAAVFEGYVELIEEAEQTGDPVPAHVEVFVTTVRAYAEDHPHLLDPDGHLVVFDADGELMAGLNHLLKSSDEDVSPVSASVANWQSIVESWQDPAMGDR